MRWTWIDKIIGYEEDRRMVAVKCVSRSEDHQFGDLTTYIGEDATGAVMPASLMIEGMAQTAGILVSTVNRFAFKVLLAKVTKAQFDVDVRPGEVIRYTADIERIDAQGASTLGAVDALSPADAVWRPVGRIDLMFSHADSSNTGLDLPEENFVLSNHVREILKDAGLSRLTEA